MAKHREAHVVPASRGDWQVVEPGAHAADSRHSTQREALAHARDLLHRQGGGEAVVHNRDGRIVSSDRVEGSH